MNLHDEGKITMKTMSLESESQLIQEALVRRIRDADRWQGVVEAWEALLKVQRTSGDRKNEQEELLGSLRTSGNATQYIPEQKPLNNTTGRTK